MERLREFIITKHPHIPMAPRCTFPYPGRQESSGKSMDMSHYNMLCPYNEYIHFTKIQICPVIYDKEGMRMLKELIENYSKEYI